MDHRVFALFGQQILLYLGIRLPSLEAAGGLMPLVVALDLLRGEVEGLWVRARSTSRLCP
jgi:small neutral amino acid transporter SnatA (MarC family)